MERGNQHRYNSLIPPREDKYNYYYFSDGDNPWAETLVRQIQAQSYVSMEIIRPEGVVSVLDSQGNTIKILAPEVTNPSGVRYDAPAGSHIEYALGIEKGSAEFSMETGRLVAWKKLYAPLETLPAFQFCKDDLSEESRAYLEQADGGQNLVLVEPEALGKTASADKGAIKEFIRAELQRAYGKGEVWFMGLVEKTVYQSWVHSWGPSAVRKIGKSRKLVHVHSYDDVALVPTVVDVDNFYANMARDILAEADPSKSRLLDRFIYMTNGLSNAKLGNELTEFRDWVKLRLAERDRMV
jgi:hypothetical protein